MGTPGTNLDIAAGIGAAKVTFEESYMDFYSKPYAGFYEMYTERFSAGNNEELEQQFITNQPTVREWLGARVEQYVRHYSQRTKLRKWEVTYPVKRTQLQYGGQLQLVAKNLRSWLGGVAMGTYDRIAVQSALDLGYLTSAAAAVGPIGFDGVALCSTAHPHGPAGANQSNLSATTPLAWGAFDTLRQAMREKRLENGEPAGIKATHMRVGPANERKAKEIAQAKDRLVFTDATGAAVTPPTMAVQNVTPFQNVWVGEVTVIVDDRLTGNTAYNWDLMDLSHPGMRPLIMVEGRPLEPHHQDQMSDERRYNHDEFLYGMEGEWVFDAGHWLTIHRATSTT